MGHDGVVQFFFGMFRTGIFKFFLFGEISNRNFSVVICGKFTQFSVVEDSTHELRDSPKDNHLLSRT